MLQRIEPHHRIYFLDKLTVKVISHKNLPLTNFFGYVNLKNDLVGDLDLENNVFPLFLFNQFSSGSFTNMVRPGSNRSSSVLDKFIIVYVELFMSNKMRTTFPLYDVHSTQESLSS